MADTELLPTAVSRLIGDKLYERRKEAAIQIEQIVKRLVQVNDQTRVRLIIDKLAADYANSNQANNRKGALLCLAAATVGLGAPTASQLQVIVPSVLRSFTDQDSRVRYYACEALYNIAKVARTSFLPYFNEVFDAMFRLCADSDTNVMNAIQFLDNLVKDIVVASPTSFNIAAFIPKLRDYLPVMSPAKRTFLISWITVLDSIPDLDMLAYLPQLLDGLMGMLADPNKEIRAQAHKALLEFLVETQATPHVDIEALGVIQVSQAGSQDDFTRLTAIKWLKELVQLSAASLVRLYPAILGVALANISHTSRDIAELSRQTSDVLLTYIPQDQAPPNAPGNKQPLPLDWHAILQTISAQLLGTSAATTAANETPQGEASRLEALRWVELLLSRARTQVLEALPALLPALLDALTSQSDAVSVGALGVFVAIARCPGYFQPTLAALLARFKGAPGVQLLQRGGAGVFRRLCGVLGPQAVFVELAQVLCGERDLAFVSTMVQALNLILLTSPEVRELREALMGAADNKATASAIIPNGPPDSQTQRGSSTGTHKQPAIQLGQKQLDQTGSTPDSAPGGRQGSGSTTLGDDNQHDTTQADAVLGASQQAAARSSSSGEAGSAANGQPNLGAALFSALYPCWSHAVGPLLSLCFLAQAYDHACEIIQCFRWLPLGAEVLVQLDRLVQLLDAPAFTPLRLSLLQPRNSRSLFYALHSLLMLLPQSNAFRALATRLQLGDEPACGLLAGHCATATLQATAAATAQYSPLATAPPTPSGGWATSLQPTRWKDVDFAGLLQGFCVKQMQHYLLETGQATPGVLSTQANNNYTQLVMGSVLANGGMPDAGGLLQAPSFAMGSTMDGSNGSIGSQAKQRSSLPGNSTAAMGASSTESPFGAAQQQPAQYPQSGQ